MSNTGEQQFTANQSIYQLLDKDRGFQDDIDLWRSVWTRLYIYFRMVQFSAAIWVVNQWTVTMLCWFPVSAVLYVQWDVLWWESNIEMDRPL